MSQPAMVRVVVPSARADAIMATSIIAVVMPATDNPYFNRMFYAIYAEAERQGRYAWLVRTPEDQPTPPAPSWMN